ncbi:MAG: hypothetical protein GF346_11130 [Candidatus Eisenbacteria bacterium]|nr:hypothetical protein [Candidatus Latescibacterota bacterium]MBD3302988.1 hypothetical protein [Candidatus Eisenbacteria bacterium]
MEARAGPRRGSRMRAVVVGAGGNVGSHLIPHLARMGRFETVALIDPDRYEEKNLRSQEIVPDEIGRPKVLVQAGRLRRIAPDLRVEAHQTFVERVAPGALLADVILSCPDSRAARQHVNEWARRLGVPWIDAGIEADRLLVRVDAYGTGPDDPCLECGWDERHYASLEQRYACDPDDPRAPATNAPSGLGALAAALMAVECEKLIEGRNEEVLFGRELLLDLLHHRQYVTATRRNPDCRLMDHAAWPLTLLDGSSRRRTLRDLLAGGPPERRVSIPGRDFARLLRCGGCGHEEHGLFLTLPGRESVRDCPRCAGSLVAAGFDRTPEIAASAIPREWAETPLDRLGVRPGDLIRLTGETEKPTTWVVGELR